MMLWNGKENVLDKDLKYVSWLALSAFGLGSDGSDDQRNCLLLLADYFEDILDKEPEEFSQLPKDYEEQNIFVAKRFIEAFENIKMKLERLTSLED